MIYKEVEIGNARLQTYVLSNYPEMDENRRRAMILICPGGGYEYCSTREAEPIAIKFNGMGYNCAVLYYTVDGEARGGKKLEKRPLYPQPQTELANAIKWIRANAEELNTNPSKIAVMGFSAGGHLAASIGCFWQEYGDTAKPNALILSYPVITSGKLAHRGSITHLTDDDPKLVQKMSLENQVTKQTPPTFLWTTKEDELVPCENSIMFSEELSKAGVYNELVVFNTGEHGLALGTKETMSNKWTRLNEEVQPWPEMADKFLIKVFGARF